MNIDIPKRIVAFLTRFAREWELFWFSEGNSSSFATFRVCHGLSLLVFLAYWWKDGAEWLSTAGFHFSDEALPPLTSNMLIPFGILQFSALILFILGWKQTYTAVMTWMCLLYVTLLDRTSAYSINSIFLFTFAVMALFPKGKNMLIAPIRLLQLGMLSIYFSSGWHKAVYGDWLASPTVLQMTTQGIYMTDIAAWSLRTMPSGFWAISQYAVLSFELFSPVLFLSRKLCPFAILAGCIFHLTIAVFMDQLIFFSLQMMSFYILFLPPLFFPKLRNFIVSLASRLLPSFNRA